MKLEIEFAVHILQAIEDAPGSLLEKGERISSFIFTEDEKYSYHCLMLEQAGLIRIWEPSNKDPQLPHRFFYVDEINAVAQVLEVDSPMPVLGEPTPEHHRVFVFPMMMTFEGHKFLDCLRTTGQRSRFADLLRERGLSLTVATAKELLPVFLRQALEQ